MENIFSKELKQTINQIKEEEQEKLRKIHELRKEEITYKNPLKILPKPIKRLYDIRGLNSIYFDDEQDLLNYIKENRIYQNIYVIDYLGSVADREDVFKVTSANSSKLYTPIDRDGYATYNEERSSKSGKYIWEYEYGSMKDICLAFKNVGVILNNDIYGKLDEEYEMINKIFRKKI